MPEIDSNDLNYKISVYRILHVLLHMCKRHDYNYSYFFLNFLTPYECYFLMIYWRFCQPDIFKNHSYKVFIFKTP